MEFIGGGGSGARGNVIVSALTTILGVDIVDTGGQYISPPRVVFNDSCNSGRGAVARAILEGDKVVRVIIDESGIDYLPSPDGSKGGSGRTWATPDETIIRRGDQFPGSGGIAGIYDTPHKPGEIVPLYPGDEYTPPGGGTQIIDEPTSITCPPLPPSGYKKGPFPSTSKGEYPVVLEIEDINIKDSGYGYDCSKDKVVIEPSNGAEFSIKCDPLGSIIGVDVIKGGIGFTEEPIIYIESDSGYNAQLTSVFRVNRVGENIEPEVVASRQIVQVIDCVSKF